MKRTVATALTVILIALQGSPVAAVTSPTCKALAEESSKFVTFLKTFVVPKNSELQDLLTAFQPLTKAAPSLSTCIAAIDPVSIYATVSLSSGYAACNASITNFTMPTNLTDGAVRTSLCPFYGATLMPCINKILVQAVVDAMASGGSCCDAMKTEIKTLFGTDLQTMAADALNKLGAALCTVKTFKSSSGATKSQACLTSLGESFFAPTTISYVLPLFQLPTEQACKAVTGQPFMTTLNEAAQFRWTDSVGICYEPLSELFKMVSAYPMLATPLTVNGSTPMAMVDAFASGKCLLFSKALQWIQQTDSLPMQWARAFDDLVAVVGMDWSGSMGADGSIDANMTTLLETVVKEAQLGMPSICIHLATGQKCDYAGATTSLNYQSTSTSTPATVSPLTQLDGSSATSLVVGVALLVITSTVSLWGV